MNWEKLKKIEDEVEQLREELPLIKQAILYRQIRNADRISIADVERVIHQEMRKQKDEKFFPL